MHSCIFARESLDHSVFSPCSPYILRPHISSRRTVIRILLMHYLSDSSLDRRIIASDISPPLSAISEVNRELIIWRVRKVQRLCFFLRSRMVPRGNPVDSRTTS
jgi:hypothetical protein